MGSITHNIPYRIPFVNENLLFHTKTCCSIQRSPDRSGCFPAASFVLEIFQIRIDDFRVHQHDTLHVINRICFLCQLLKRMKPHRIKLCALIITNFFFPYFSKFSSSGTLALLYAIISLPPSLLLMKEPFTKMNRELFRFNPCLSFDEVKIKPNRLT